MMRLTFKNIFIELVQFIGFFGWAIGMIIFCKLGNGIAVVMAILFPFVFFGVLMLETLKEE